jgi:hypothetical protein
MPIGYDRLFRFITPAAVAPALCHQPRNLAKSVTVE